MAVFMDSLLIVHQGALGDILLTLPSVSGLRKRYRRTDILCQDKIGRLVCALKMINRHLPLEAASFASLYSDAPEGRKKDDSAKQVLASYTQIVLFSNSVQLEETLKAFTRKPVCRIPPRPDPGDRIHVTDYLMCNLVMCNLAGKGFGDLSESKEPLRPPLLWGGNRLEYPAEDNKVVIHPGSGSKRKLWPLSNFITVARRLRSKGMHPEFVLGPAEYSLKEPLLAHGEDMRQVLCFSDLNELLGRLKTAAGFIGNDSGVTHLAALMNIPTVAVFGPSDPKRWHPVGQAVEIVRPDLDCSPCFETEPALCKTPDCLDLTSPEQVLKAFSRVLRLSSGEKPFHLSSQAGAWEQEVKPTS